LTLHTRGLVAAPRLAGVADDDAARFFEFVRRTPADAVIVFPKSRALALIGDRAAVASDPFSSDDEFARFFAAAHATYIAVGPPGDETTEAFALRHHAPLAFSAGAFRVYALR